jgi:uncharacterized protein YceK
MTKTRAAGLLALAAVWQAGCGTIVNFAQGDPDIYGGVQKDIQFIETPRKQGGGGVGVNTGMLLAVLAPLDTCLSLVGDTLTLPLAICLRHNEHESDGKIVIGGNSSSPANADKPQDSTPPLAPLPPPQVSPSH